MREKLLLDGGWQFHEGELPVPQSAFKGYMYTHAKTQRAISGPASPDNYRPGWVNTDDWSTVNLPHDYVIAHTPERKNNEALGYLPYNNAWYRRAFKLTAEDASKRVTLYFEGVATHATVWVNGCLMAHSFCGYTPFEIDITDVAKFDADNLVAVYVETSDHEGWWYEGAGIYRHVWLTKTPMLSVDRWGIFVKPKKTDGGWVCEVETTVRNDTFGYADFTAAVSIINKAGETTASGSFSGSLERKSVKAFTETLAVPSPDLWDTETPNMYTARVTLTSASGEDACDVRFGFREAVFDPERGLLLNGKPTKIKGVCCHGDFGLTGKAVPDNILRYRVRLLREMGANGYRCSHYPHAEATLDALDDNGFLVMAETRWFESTKEGREQLAALVKRDRNHPSVVMWSLGNEEPFFARQEGKRVFQTLYAVVKRLDDSRPVMASVSHSPATAPIFEVADLIGINYNLPAYDELRKVYPNKCFISSENCATPTTRGHYFESESTTPIKSIFNAMDATVSNWQSSREVTWNFIMERDWVAGGYQWAGIEHRGETEWPRLCSQSGALDLFLQKKDAFYQNQSYWTDKPMIHLLPHWNFAGREGEEMRVWAYTNCPAAELFLNGVSLGRVELGRFSHAEWTVPYAPGELKVVGYSADGAIVSDAAVTSGQPDALRLELQNGADLRANGADLALFNCYAVDAEGRVVPDASPVVTFDAANGAVVATGSSVFDHIPPANAAREMRAGLAAVAVRPVKPGALRLYASAPGLGTARAEITL